MAPKLRPTQGGTTYALDDLYDRLEANPGDAEALAELEAVQRDIDIDEERRLGSASTHKRQDLHLMRFIKTMRLHNREVTGYKDLSDDEVIEKEITNAGKVNVVSNLRRYLRFEAHYMRPTSQMNDRPRYQSVAQCRNSMIHWILHYQKEEAPGMNQLIHAANQTLQVMGDKVGFNTKRQIKTYFGRFELTQLIDWDTTHAPFLPLAESHHLAWCIACVCGVRPGSIGTTRGHGDQFLSFRDIEITRAREIGFFNVKIDFQYLKGNRDSLIDQTPLTFFVNGATTIDFLPLSIPHRLLVMLLRREGLQDHSDLDSLLNGKERLIKIKPDMLDQPICRAGGPRGLSVTGEPVTADNLTAYISRVARAAGYPRGITMYCWRRKAATEWLRTVGLDRAKQMMDHGQDSNLIWRHYEQGLFDIPVFEIAMRADTGGPRITMDEDSPEVLHRMIEFRKIKGSYVDARVNELLHDNKEYQEAQEAEDFHKMSLLRRRARNLIQQIIYDEQKKLHDQALSLDEFHRRQDELKEPGTLVRMIQEGTKSALQERDLESYTGSAAAAAAEYEEERGAGHEDSMDIDSSLPGDLDFNRGFLDRDLEADDLLDAEDDFGSTGENSNRSEIVVQSDANASYDNDTNINETRDEFAFAVLVFMESLSHITFVVQKELRCELCRSNPYFTQEEKDKVWRAPSKLADHQFGREHSKSREMARRFEYEAANHPEHRYECPYYGCEKSYSEIKSLIGHIKKSGPPLLNDNITEEEREQLQLHDDDKRADGWYDSDFKYDVKAKRPELVRENRRRGLGLKYSDMQELTHSVRAKVVTSYDMILGDAAGAHMTEIPEHYNGFIAFGNAFSSPHPAPVPAHYRGVLALGNNDSVQAYDHPFNTRFPGEEETLRRGDEYPRYIHPGVFPETQGL